MFRQRLAAEGLYKTNIRDIKLKLVGLQVEDNQVWKIRAEKLGRNLKDSNRILHYESLPYVFEIMKTELISMQYDELPVAHFGIKKS